MNSKRLIEKGFFPKDLPPPFTTKFFAEFYEKNSSKLPKPEKFSRGINFSCPRVGIIRKGVVITNPAHQAPLSDFIARKWPEILKVYNRSEHSCSKPIIKGLRAIQLPPYKDFLQKCFTESFHHRIQLKTDISKFFPSIYTHSIPWAIHTKVISKKNFSKNLWGNELDELVRYTQHNQTIGIPIGPDTSHIISEIIGAAIDEYIQSKFPDAVGCRYVDDMYFCFESQATAEVFMKEIRHIFKEYELQVNATKTELDSLPVGIEDEWVITLRKFEFGKTATQQKHDLISYFSLAFNYAKQYPSNHVLSYAIRRIKHVFVHHSVFSIYQAMLSKTTLAETATLPDVLEILLSYKTIVNKTKLQKTINALIQYSAPRALDFEVAWGIWYAISFNIKLNTRTTKSLNGIIDPVSILLALDALNRNLLAKGVLNTTSWKNTITEDSLWDENWILAYEISIKKWLKTSYKYISSSQKNLYFQTLRKNQISFYDPSLQIPVSNDFTKKPSESEIEKTIKKAFKFIVASDYDY